MMMNLFSSFDPSTSHYLSMNWISTIIWILIIPSMYWLIPSRLTFLWIKLINFTYNEFKIILPLSSKSTTLILSSLFTFILMNNFLGLFPYIFTSTSHMTFTLSLSLTLWLTFFIFGMIHHTTHMFAHLVPSGAPAILLPFLVLIELTSMIIRPGTLAIRLTANMIAGHLLLTLLGSMGPLLNSVLTINLLIIGQILLLILESAVSIIQAYVFSVLTTLYASEIN